jgi:hypothetical protein
VSRACACLGLAQACRELVLARLATLNPHPSSSPLPPPPPQDLASKAMAVVQGQVPMEQVVDAIKEHEIKLLTSLVGGGGTGGPGAPGGGGGGG